MSSNAVFVIHQVRVLPLILLILLEATKDALKSPSPRLNFTRQPQTKTQDRNSSWSQTHAIPQLLSIINKKWPFPPSQSVQMTWLEVFAERAMPTSTFGRWIFQTLNTFLENVKMKSHRKTPRKFFWWAQPRLQRDAFTLDKTTLMMQVVLITGMWSRYSIVRFAIR